MATSDNIQINEATLDEKPILRQLLELYEYDFSEFERTDVGPHGIYGYRYLDHYWTEPDCHPYLIRVDGQLAGFVLVNRHGASGQARWSLAEFFVMRKYRKQGVGEFAATFVFNLWPGEWEVSQAASHPGSTAFWRKVIGRYTGGGLEERQGEAGKGEAGKGEAGKGEAGKGEAGKGMIQLFDSPGHAQEQEEDTA